MISNQNLILTTLLLKQFTVDSHECNVCARDSCHYDTIKEATLRNSIAVDISINDCCSMYAIRGIYPALFIITMKEHYQCFITLVLTVKEPATKNNHILNHIYNRFIQIYITKFYPMFKTKK